MPTQEIDVMLEVKDKNLSAFKALNLLATPDIKRLEKEWDRYEYLVLEHSLKIHQQIEQLLAETEGYPIFEFYRLIDEALALPIESAHAITQLKPFGKKCIH